MPQSLVREGSDLQVARLSAFSNSSCTALLLAEGFRINPVPVMPATVFSDACMSHARQRRMFFLSYTVYWPRSMRLVSLSQAPRHVVAS